jgi:ribonuclease VapC
MNEINIGEVFYRTAKDKSMERAEAVMNSIVALPIQRLPNGYHDVLAAARLKAYFPISYGDAFAVATAQRESATLVTGDPEFHAVEHLIPIRWI